MGLGDCPCLTPIEQNWEDAGPVEVHLGVCIYMGPPDVLFKETEACTLLQSLYVAISQPHFLHRARSETRVGPPIPTTFGNTGISVF